VVRLTFDGVSGVKCWWFGHEFYLGQAGGCPSAPREFTLRRADSISAFRLPLSAFRFPLFLPRLLTAPTGQGRKVRTWPLTGRIWMEKKLPPSPSGRSSPRTRVRKFSELPTLAEPLGVKRIAR
jgi:hypothetical protein